MHAGLHMVGNRHAVAHRVQPDDVTHHDGIIQAAGQTQHRLTGHGQTGQGFTHLIDR